MNLCLINIPYLSIYGKINVGHNSSYPLGLGYISSIVKRQGHKVLLLDPEAAGMTQDQALIRIKGFSPNLIGLSCVTANFSTACEWAKRIKDEIKCTLMIGGVHVTALPEKSLKDCPEIDFVVQGEGEYVVTDICDNIERGNFDLANIPSLCYRLNGNIINNPRAEVIRDLDKLPYPDRESVDLNWYRLQPQFERGKLHATVLSSRGCPSSCTFCGNIVTGRKFRPRSVTSFVDELEYLLKNCGIRHFHIIDDNFAVDKKRVVGICEEIIARKLKITWFIFGRIDHLNDEKLLRIMKKAGCVYILFGIESGNQEILNKIKKYLTLEEIKKTCYLCRKVGIRYFNSFIIGSQGDTKKTVQETLKFAIELKSVMAGFSIMVPFPGSPVFNEYYRDKIKNITDWSKWCPVGDDLPFDYLHTELTRQELLTLAANAYYKYYLRPAQLLRIIQFGYQPRIILSYLRGGFGILRASANWIRKK